MPLPWADRWSRVAATVAAAAVLAACGGGKPGVGIADLTTDVVFGLAEEETAGPANFNPAPIAADQAGNRLLPDQLFDDDPGFNDRLDFSPVRPTPTADPCPEAAFNEFPDEPVAADVPMEPLRLPSEGLYKWQRSGTLASAETANIEVDVSGFEERLIRNAEVVERPEQGIEDAQREVTEDDKSAMFRYETVQPEISTDNVVVTSFQAKTNGRTARARPAVTVTEGDGDLAAYEPEGGLVLKEVRTETPDGEVVTQFRPAPTGLLLLPLPVVAGSRFSSVATDPVSGQQLRLEARVVRPDRVDACGDLIEGWRVESTLDSTGPGAQFSRSYTYLVAPQYGAILLHERIEQAGGGDRNLSFTIGQQEPTPVASGKGQS